MAEQTMRDLVISTILADRKAGLDEVGINYIVYSRERNKEPVLPIGKYEYDSDIPADELERALKAMSDTELLSVLDSQACQRYR